jgi:hypothetical protein
MSSAIFDPVFNSYEFVGLRHILISMGKHP